MSMFRIITADERLARPRRIKGVIVGPSGIGKTSLLWTLDPATTLFIDLEAGDLAVQGWPGDSLQGRTWEECRDLACLVSGPNPALRPEQPFSRAHYDFVRTRAEAESLDLARYRTVFVDSITVASRLALSWAKGQPQAFSDRSGKPDGRAAYGLLGQEMVGWLTQWQHADLNVWLVGILERRTDDLNRISWGLQVEGGKTGLELPGIVDEVVAMVELRNPANAPYRAFVCHTLNDWGFPAKDRSGRLETVEPPHLGRLMDKIAGAAPAPVPAVLDHRLPPQASAADIPAAPGI
jgi:hypothetical protein